MTGEHFIQGDQVGSGGLVPIRTTVTIRTSRARGLFDHYQRAAAATAAGCDCFAWRKRTSSLIVPGDGLVERWTTAHAVRVLAGS